MDYSEGQGFVVLDENDIEDYNEDGILPQSPEILMKIKKWLQPTDYLADSSEYNKHLNSHVPGTSLWIQETEAYRLWHDSPDHGSLWTKAIAGAGKSVFAAMIAAQLAQEKVPVLTFFFRQIIATNHDPQSLVRDWISMVLKHFPPLQARMKKYIDDGRALHDVSFAEFWQELDQALISLPKVYCIVDALDEMDIERQSFFEDLVALGQRKSSTIKLLMTSRPLPRIEAYLKDASILQVRLEQLQVDRDIDLYLDWRLNTDSRMDISMRTAVKQGIGRKAQGSFLYARLMTEELLARLDKTALDVNLVQRSLESLPVTLEDMYTGMLRDHSLRSQVPQDLQVNILRWVCNSSRPLRLLELATMLDFQGQLGHSTKDNKALVRVACGPLLEILEDETVSVIHHSFTEFLFDSSRNARRNSVAPELQYPVLDSLAAHRSMSLTCLNYITSGCLNSWRLGEPPNSRQRMQQSIKLPHPFIDYAASNWYIHVRKSGPIKEALLTTLKDFMRTDRADFRAWIDIVWGESHDFSKLSVLHAAAWAGMPAYVKYLLDQGAESNARDKQGRTPLSWAASRGHTECVALLLEHADPDSDDSNGLKPLHYAARTNHHEIVSLLINAGVSPLTGKTRDPGRRCGNIPSTIGDTPWKYASRSGSTESVQIMIPLLGAKDLNDALGWACEHGRAAIVDILLELPQVTPDHPQHQETPLFLASKGLHYHIMHALLDKGADPNKRSANNRHWPRRQGGLPNPKYGPTPLHAVCIREQGNTNQIHIENAANCLQLLLNAGGDTNMVDNTGKTALHLAVAHYLNQSKGCLLKLLLDNDADPNAQDSSGDTPLHLINLNSSDAAFLIDLLLSSGARFDMRTKQGRAPLHTMCDSCWELDLNILLPHVKDWNCQDSTGNTPLHILLSKSSQPTAPLKSMLAMGADLNLKNRAGEAPIHVIRDSSTRDDLSKSILSTLLEAGASLETRDNEGKTFLLRNLGKLSFNPHPPLKYLLDLGANINARDYNGNCVLHIICKKGQSIDLFQALVATGADPLSVNHAGDTLLHEVLSVYNSGHPEQILRLIKLLLEFGVPPGARNNRGQTALHLAMKLQPPAGAGKKTLLNEILHTKLSEFLDIEDNDGIRSIHLATTVSEALVSKLIDCGVDATAVTNDDMSVLHIASRARQSNTIGRLLEHFVGLGRGDMLHLQDKTGRSALHYACRSGRPESVALLLRAGADPNIPDNKSRLPLHACAEYESDRIQEGTGLERPDALRISEEDIYRQNRSQKHQGLPLWDWNSTNNHSSTRVREIVRLLLEHGSKMSANDELTQERLMPLSPLSAAISLGCAEVVDELVSYIENESDAIPIELESASRPPPITQPFQQRYLINTTRLILSKDDLPKDGSVSSLCYDLLSLRQYKAIEQLPILGADFSPHANYLQKDFMSTLAQHGYVALFEKLGASIQRPGWVNGLASSTHIVRDTVPPYLIRAASRELPNLDMIKLIVEKFGANINIQPEVAVNNPHQKVRYAPGDSALHVLARGNHFWQTEAIKYMLSRGANPELRNAQGQTAINIENIGCSPYRERQIVEILLKHGADPNSMDYNGSTRLNKSMHDIEIIRLLIKYRAEISLVGQSVLLSAINCQDVEIIKILIDMGIDVNAKPEPIEASKFKVQQQSRQYHEPRQRKRYVESELYPLHYAALAKFNTPKTRGSALLIIELLLENGADPYLQFNDNTTIINEIFLTGGIIQPFLDYPDLRLEASDTKGQTLLLAACRSSFGSTRPTTFPVHHFQSAEAKILEQSKYTKSDPCRSLVVYEKGGNLLAVDNEGNNALHLLLGSGTHDNDEFQKTFRIFLDKAPSLIHQKNAAGNTPFHTAISNFNPQFWAADLLIEVGANPLEKDGLGNTPLHFIAPQLCNSLASEEWLPRFEKFLSLGLDINEQNNLGETPVFNYLVADERGGYMFRGSPDAHCKYFSPFEKAGANLSLKNNEGETLLHLTAKVLVTKTSYGPVYDGVSTFKFLMEKGVDPMVEDRFQRTALDVAAAYGHSEILALFQRDNPHAI